MECSPGCRDWGIREEDTWKTGRVSMDGERGTPAESHLGDVRLPEQGRWSPQSRFTGRQGRQGLNIAEAAAADAFFLQTERPRKGVWGADTRETELPNLGFADALAETKIHGNAPDRVTIMIFIINNRVNGHCPSNIFSEHWDPRSRGDTNWRGILVKSARNGLSPEYSAGRFEH